MLAPLHRPLDALLRPSALIAVILAGEALAALLALSPVPANDRLVLFGLMSLGIQWIALGTLAAIYVLGNLLGRLPPHVLAWACLGLLLLMTLLLVLLAWWLLDLHQTHDQDFTTFLFRTLALALVAGLLALLAYQNHWRARHLAVRAKQAELDALQARIHPHFLFNTLNTGVALVHQQPEKLEQLLLDLADLFRAALAGPARIPLHEELDLTRRYIEIERLRFGSRMQLLWELPDPLPDLLVPTLSIQPLVENAIHHGVEPSAQTCTLRIAVEHDTRQVRITIDNDLPETRISMHQGHQVGLQAARTRTQAMGGDVEAGTKDNKYRAVLSLPWK